MSDLQATAARLVTEPGAGAPPGIVLGIDTAGLKSSVSAGHRTVRWDGDVRHGVSAMTVETHHDLASVTKVVATTTALIRLVSAGLVDLDSAVRRHLPQFTGDATVRDLLLHRAGLWEWYPLYITARQVEELPLRYEPRRQRHYSDLGFILLGRIIATAFGDDLERAVAELVTTPLGLTSTRFAHPAGEAVATGARDDRVEMTMLDTGQPYPVPHRSTEFTGWRHHPIDGEVADGNSYHAFGGVSGHAGLFSTVPDLLRWATALADYEEHDALWRPDVAREFFAALPDQSEALGFRRYRLDLSGETVTVLGHPGYVGCAAGFVPGRSIALALGSNRLLVAGTTPVPTETLFTELLTTTSDLLRPD
ncbi:class A beta-lactamase-related serine hydrolase [Kribbella capetownensis]|uniref:Class A beta-lactamase-related serine hydrolase n=1 Tax=Kribbella capetownensis TaxID=1572659 RepID=A0A4V2M7V6_9ACTN|nr:serine hydrolase domain-containing protein [Kribbella capetownensis]TCC49052.1 class A beta-lactamase-related serine hydrolase [Kribbella capetownensis]